MKRNDWAVGDYGVRPNGPQDECFYCRVKRGDQHRMGCVIRERTAVVRMTIEYVRAIPEDWDRQRLEFFHNEGSRCCNNDVEELQDLVDRLDKADGGRACVCEICDIRYVREATEEDEDNNQLFVKNSKS